MTKTEMAKVIVRALYNLNEEPRSDHRAVVRISRMRKDLLVEEYKLAERVLNNGK